LYVDDQKMGYINMSVPVEVHVNSKDLKDGSLNLLELRPSLKQLRNNFKYFIVDGNQDKWFKLHRRNRFSSLHSSQRHIEENGDVPAGVYKMKLKGRNTLSDESIKKSSFNSDKIEEAIRQDFDLLVDIYVRDD